MDKTELKKRMSIRIYAPHKQIVEKEFGSVQKGFDFFIQMLEKYGRNNFLKYIREKVQREQS